MNQVLLYLSSLINLAGLAVSLCLGLYIVTRTPRSRLSWLAALTLWILSGWGLVAVGLARVLSHTGDALFAMAAARRVVGVRPRDLAGAAGPPLLGAGVMGALVYGIGAAPGWTDAPILRLVTQVTVGVVVYGALMALFHRRACLSTLAEMRR